MATLKSQFEIRVSIGGEEKRIDVSRDLTVTGLAVVDATLNIVENTPANPAPLFQAVQHGQAAPVAEFVRGFFGVDTGKVAKDAGLADLPLDLELSWTSTGGAVVTRITRVYPDALLTFSAVGGASGAAATDVLTRIRVTNPAAVGSPANSNDRQARLVLIK